jgi:hypothetical protein
VTRPSDVTVTIADASIGTLNASGELVPDQSVPEFEARLDRDGASPGQVPVLQEDGALAFGTVSGSGGAAVSDATPSTKGLVRLAGDLGGTASAPTVPALAGKADTDDLAAVATSGSYGDLTGRPAIPAAPPDAGPTTTGLVRLTGDLGGTATAPTVPALADKADTADLAAVASSGAYGDLTGRPGLAAVALSGAYTDLSGRPTIPAAAGDIGAQPAGNYVTSTTITTIVRLTQAAYDALATKDASTLYAIVG